MKKIILFLFLTLTSINSVSAQGNLNIENRTDCPMNVTISVVCPEDYCNSVGMYNTTLAPHTSVNFTAANIPWAIDPNPGCPTWVYSNALVQQTCFVNVGSGATCPTLDYCEVGYTHPNNTTCPWGGLNCFNIGTACGACKVGDQIDVSFSIATPGNNLYVIIN